MTVQELIDAAQAAIQRGLPPTTTVVMAFHQGEHDYVILEETADPSDGGDYDMWFTLMAPELQAADSRFTEGGMSPEWYAARDAAAELEPALRPAGEGGWGLY